MRDVTNQQRPSGNARTWTTELVGPVPATHRGQLICHLGGPYLAGTVWVDTVHGVRVGRLTFGVYEEKGMVLLDNIDVSSEHRGKGAGRALMDSLELAYPSADRWWFAAERLALHSEEGLALIYSRRKPGRQYVHTADCDSPHSTNCDCEFPQRCT